MTTDNTYNGWTNYETWSVKLWIDNDSGAYHFWRDVVAAVLEGVVSDSDRANTVTRLAEQLKDVHEESMPEVTGMYADLLQGALDAVNWREIAHHMLEEFAE